MSPWMRHLHWRQIWIGGVWYLVIASVFRQIAVAFTMQFYQNPEYIGVWSRLMMPAEGPPPLAFYVVSILFTYVTGCTLAAVYDRIKGALGKRFGERVVGFTDIMVGLSIVFGYFPMYLLFHVPVMLLVWWLGAGWATVLFSSMVFANLMKS